MLVLTLLLKESLTFSSAFFLRRSLPLPPVTSSKIKVAVASLSMIVFFFFHLLWDEFSSCRSQTSGHHCIIAYETEFPLDKSISVLTIFFKKHYCTFFLLVDSHFFMSLVYNFYFIYYLSL